MFARLEVFFYFLLFLNGLTYLHILFSFTNTQYR